MSLPSRVALLSALAALSYAPSAFAHVALAGPAFAGQTQVLTFGVGHGCEGADTVEVEVAIPKEVTTVRALPNVFGEATVVQDDAGLITAVRWSKADARAADDQYYQLGIRIKVPDAAFTTLSFPARQTCRNAAGEETVVNWDSPPDAEPAKSGEESHPAPVVTVLPARSPGWNKFTAPSKLTALTIFDDAQIVWVNDDAYSSNPTTKALIAADDGVGELKEIAAGVEIWVKY